MEEVYHHCENVTVSLFDTARNQQGNKFKALGSIKTFQSKPSKWKPIIKIIIIRGMHLLSK